MVRNLIECFSSRLDIYNADPNIKLDKCFVIAPIFRKYVHLTGVTYPTK